MINTLKDLAVCYPFLPVSGTTVPELFKHIKDIRIKIVLPSREPLHTGMNTKVFSAQLNAITAATATFLIDCTEYGKSEELKVPVYTDMNTCPVTDSYVLMDTELEASGLAYEVHPNCLIFMQEAPLLKMQTNTPDSQQVAFSNTIKLKSGYNTSISYSGGTLDIYGAGGAGIGKYPSSPSSAIPSVITAATGLRSINGISGAVSITGSSSVDVQILKEESTLLITINPRPAPESLQATENSQGA